MTIPIASGNPKRPENPRTKPSHFDSIKPTGETFPAIWLITQLVIDWQIYSYGIPWNSIRSHWIPVESIGYHWIIRTADPAQMLLAPALRNPRGNALRVVTGSAQRWRRVAVTEDKVPKGNANREENGLDIWVNYNELTTSEPWKS